MEVLGLIFIFAMIIGWNRAGNQMKAVRKNPKIGVEKTKDPCSFIYFDIN